MAEISTEKVRELRDKTGAGMMDCKRALATAGGDLEKAIDHLRKEGVVKAAKKAGRTTSEGLIGASSYSGSPDRKAAALFEVNCETDFVARTDQFQNFISALGEHIVKGQPADLDALNAQKMGDVTVQDALSQLVSKVGENIAIRRFHLIRQAAGEVIGSYLHAGSKIGAVVRVRSAVGGDKVPEEAVRDIAMHVAAMGPRFIGRDQVPADVIAREKDIFKASPELTGKPEVLQEKIIVGKLNRFYSEACLTEQPFIKDATGKKTVGDYLKGIAAGGSGAQIVEVVRYQVGEEIH